MSNFEKAVKGGTKVKLAPPKSKYVEHILMATQTGESGVAEVFRTLTLRLRDSTWTVAFKSLIIVHLMIKEGAQDVTLRYLSAAPKNRLAISSFTDVQTQGHNIRVYSEYLLARAQAYDRGKCDYVRSGEGRMKRLTVDKGLLRETEVVQDQIRALVRCTLLENDVENEISLTAFRLLTRDLLDLYNVENEAVMNVLSHYFEMSRPDAERAITIYKRFCKQTEEVVQYLSVARRFEHATRLEIPKLKHAPTSLAASLQEYLDDKDFEVNRRQYLAEQEAKKSGRATSKPTLPTSSTSTKMATPFDEKPSARTAATTQPAKGPAPDLIDFFESIDQNQQTMQTNPFLQQQQPQATGYQQPQQTGYQQDAQQYMNQFGANGGATNPYAQQQQPFAQQEQPQILQTQFTGAGFGGYGPQPTQQQTFAPATGFGQEQQQQQYTSPVQTQSTAPLQQQITNPFRASMIASGSPGGLSPQAQQQTPQRSGTNPFARSGMSAIPEDTSAMLAQQQSQQNGSPFSSQPTYQQQPIQVQPTGTNPFARNQTPTQQPTPPMSPPGALQVQPTGSTNPFRQSMFVNQQTGSGWQNGPQGTMGGLEGLETVPVFPRIGAQSTQQQQQQQQQSPWG